MGLTGGFTRTVKKYMDSFEQGADTYSKAAFKKLNLHHWSQQSKMIIFLLSAFAPTCFALIAGFCMLIIAIYNKVMFSMYKKKIDSLEEQEKNLLE